LNPAFTEAINNRKNLKRDFFKSWT
jgi:hypothetical protein